MKLVIDMANPYGPEIRSGPLRLEGQWVELYGLLALRRTTPARHDEFVDERQLHTMSSWASKRASSVGKEVARHCKRLERLGQPLIDSSRKTKLWRLALEPEQIEFRPARATTERWIRTRTRAPEISGRWIDQLETLVRAQIALQSGEGAEARERLRPLGALVTPELDAWAALIDARGTDQFVDLRDNPDVLDALAAAWLECRDAAARSVAARILARAAMRKRFTSPDTQYAELSRHAAELERHGDVAALAAVINVLGILATRCDRLSEAVHHHLRAAALFGIVGDYHSLEAAVFNAANTWVRARRLDDQGPDELALRLIDLSTELCATFSVGRDTVQAPVSGVHWAIDLGQRGRARAYLELGARLVDSLDSSYEQACYLMARARLELFDPSGEHDPVRDLKAARRAFEAAGAAEPIVGVETMLARALDQAR